VPLDPVKVLTELIAVPSVNPMGRSVEGPPFGESRLTDHLERLLKDIGLATRRQAVEPGRENLLATLDGQVPASQGGRLVLLDAHQDTVPVEGMTVEPFRAVVRDGRLYGRGACDTKGGMAAMLAAISRLAEERPTGMPIVVLSCSVNEEYGFGGARQMAKAWGEGGQGLVPRRPDAAIIAEPTELDVVTVHKGVVRWKCHTRGRAAHSSRPEAGDNAIYKMARAVTAIEKYARDVVGTLATHPLCGPATLSVGTITGGVSVNTVPDRCTIEIDRRLAPGEKPDAARQHLIDYLREKASLGFTLEHDPPFMEGPPLADQHNRPLADRLAKAAAGLAAPCRAVGVPYGTDGALFAATGVPTVIFGPGSIAQAHTADEWIALDQVEKAAEIYYRFVKSFC